MSTRKTSPIDPARVELVTGAGDDGSIRRGARGDSRVSWGVHEGPFGRFLLAATDQGVCALRFLRAGAASEEAEVESLRREWPRATVLRDQERTARHARRVFAPRGGESLPLHLRGTRFQIRVWRELLKVAAGEVTSYAALAGSIGAPRSVRAVGGAVARNPILYLVPCHRVIRSDGDLGGYRAGPKLKADLLRREAHPEARRGSGRRRRASLG